MKKSPKSLSSFIKYLTKHSKLLFVISLVFVFPILFIYSLGQFVEASNDNVKTVLQEKISSIHDVVEVMVVNDYQIQNGLEKISSRYDDVTKIRISKETPEGMLVLYKLAGDEVSKIDENWIPYRTSLVDLGETTIYGLAPEKRQKTQAARAINKGDQTLYIFTEHDFSSLYTVLENRVIYAHLSLSLIFVFLIALTYWIVRQIDYRKKYLKSQKELNELSLFVDSLAHELRSPLTAIRGYADLIMESDSYDSSNKDFASKIKMSSDRLVSLVSDFLEAARIQAGKLKLEITSEDLKTSIESVVTELKPMAEVKKLTLFTNLPDKPVIMETDHRRFKQILINLTNNAIKYTDKGDITISLEKNSIITTVTVADNGSGISAENQKQLFSPFVRFAENNKNKKVVGSGLGMWITKQLVEQLKGDISVESIKDVGTHVVLKFKNEAFKD